MDELSPWRQNTVRLLVYNSGMGYSFSFTLYRDGVAVRSWNCGQVDRSFCNNDQGRKEQIVYDHYIAIQGSSWWE
jgi:hypothetical protein